MKVFGSICEIVFFLVLSDFLYLAQVTGGANEFRRCYNTSTDMHCFDVQYDNQSNQWLHTSFDVARKRCSDLNSNLIIIRDEETNQIVGKFFEDPYNPIRLYKVWTDAYRVNAYNETYRWQWLNSTLPNMSASDVDYTPDLAWYVASLAFRDKGFYLTAQQPHFPSRYICEYTMSICSSMNSDNTRVFNGKCYTATNEQLNWYEARNRCLKGGGDLSSFANVTSTNFASWLGSDPNIRYWIGLRFARYIWKDSGEDVKFAKWINNNDWSSPCLTWCFYCNPNFIWLPNDCNIVDSIRVVCHTVTSLIPTTTIDPTTSTVPAITTDGIKALTSSEIHQNNSSPSSKESNMAIGVGVGVGVGVPVIIAIVLIAICVIRRHRLKTTSQPSSRHAHPETLTAEDQGHRSGGDENDQYAFVPMTLSSKPTAARKEATTETQYAALGFPEKDNSKNENNSSPLDIL